MFSAYFNDLEKFLLKKYKPTGKSAPAKKAKGSSYEYPELAQAVDGMISPLLATAHASIVDASGYSPAPAEITIYKKPFKNMEEIFSGKIPSDLVLSTVHVSQMLDRKTLLEKLVEVAQVKKSDRFTEGKENPSFIGSFMIAFDSSYLMDELKSSVLEIYKEQNVDPEFEVDIIAILGKGIMIKNWREKRSYVALETGAETLQWFFVLANEYLDVEKPSAIDLRSLVRDQKTYKEY